MPTYEYFCIDCQHEFEELQSISAPPITSCPECGGNTERKITGGTGFVFKGSGFYITENRKKDYKADAEKDKPAPVESPSTKKNDPPKSSTPKKE